MRVALRIFIMLVLASGCSAITLASELHKNRGTCCTAEWPCCLLAMLWLNQRLKSPGRRCMQIDQYCMQINVTLLHHIINEHVYNFSSEVYEDNVENFSFEFALLR